MHTIEIDDNYTIEDFFNPENRYHIDRFPEQSCNVAFDFDEMIVILEANNNFRFANLEWLRQFDRGCYNRYFELRTGGPDKWQR
jgi:hypothetical protein